MLNLKDLWLTYAFWRLKRLERDAREGRILLEFAAGSLFRWNLTFPTFPCITDPYVRLHSIFLKLYGFHREKDLAI
jgi:hypothetical protein